LQKRPAEGTEAPALGGLAALQAKKQQTSVSTGISFLQNKRAIVESTLDISPPKKQKANDENKPPLFSNKPAVGGGLAALAALKKSSEKPQDNVKPVQQVPKKAQSVPAEEPKESNDENCKVQ
jgi:hypothetical protein